MASAEAPAGTIRVEVGYCPAPGEIDVSRLALPAGATLSDALRASGVLERHAVPGQDLRAGVWNKVRPLDTLLREGDRVELYRPLKVDPKEARRQRYKGQKSKTAAAADPS